MVLVQDNLQLGPNSQCFSLLSLQRSSQLLSSSTDLDSENEYTVYDLDYFLGWVSVTMTLICHLTQKFYSLLFEFHSKF